MTKSLVKIITITSITVDIILLQRKEKLATGRNCQRRASRGKTRSAAASRKYDTHYICGHKMTAHGTIATPHTPQGRPKEDNTVEHTQNSAPQTGRHTASRHITHTRHTASLTACWKGGQALDCEKRAAKGDVAESSRCKGEFTPWVSPGGVLSFP